MKYIILIYALIGFGFNAQAGMFGETPDRCVVAGCSNELCVETSKEDVASACLWTPAYGCYKAHGTCEMQKNGNCGWTPTEALKQCLADPEKEFPL
ncbi:MAG: hypothetical protein MK052_05980 [Alphaproteobacteria bacterium]|nr:hypothetical protein [Alphaproteobacteria bacterium]